MVFVLVVWFGGDIVEAQLSVSLTREENVRLDWG